MDIGGAMDRLMVRPRIPNTAVFCIKIARCCQPQQANKRPFMLPSERQAYIKSVTIAFLTSPVDQSPIWSTISDGH